MSFAILFKIIFISLIAYYIAYYGTEKRMKSYVLPLLIVLTYTTSNIPIYAFISIAVLMLIFMFVEMKMEKAGKSLSLLIQSIIIWIALIVSFLIGVYVDTYFMRVNNTGAYINLINILAMQYVFMFLSFLLIAYIARYVIALLRKVNYYMANRKEMKLRESFKMVQSPRINLFLILPYVSLLFI